MVVGDVVNGIGAASANVVFQPAASVSCMITVAAIRGNWVQLTDGSLLSLVMDNGAGGSFNNINNKIFIDNSIYLHVSGGGGYSASFTGIQIK
mgnify:CR=1 FL=1|tara:strand:- start:3 stop:281 length:279 start_codon:yes stop_codon:yes gene_type:complete